MSCTAAAWPCARSCATRAPPAYRRTSSSRPATSPTPRRSARRSRTSTASSSSADGPHKVEHEASVIDAAAGVDLLVKASTIGAQPGAPLEPFDWNGRSEEHLRRSGVPAVILQSAFYMTNLLALADPMRARGVLPAPAGDGKIGMIDPRDIGAVAAAVLTGTGHEGRTYRLTGPRAVGYRDVAVALSAAIGRHIEYVDVPPAVARDGVAASGMPDWLVDHLDRLFALIRRGALAEVTDTVRVLTGHDARGIDDFVRDHAAAFASATVGV